MQEDTVTIEFNKAALLVTLDAVSHRLQAWPGGDQAEQINLMQLQHTLRAAHFEFTYQQGI